MNETRRSPSRLLVAASLVVVVAGLKAAAPLLVPFAMALLLAILSFPLQRWLRQRRIPKGVAVLLTVLANLALLVGLGLVVRRSLSGFAAAVPRYRAGLERLLDRTTARLAELGLPVEDWLAGEIIGLESFVDLVGSTLLGVASIVTDLLLVLLFLIFLLLETDLLPTKMMAAFGHDPERADRMTRAGAEVQRYLVIKTAVSLATGVTVGLGMAAVGLDFPLLWGLMAFLLNYIPNLGSVLAAIPAVLLALIQLGPALAIVVAAVYVAVNFLLGNLLEPQLMGRRLGLSPLVVFVSLIFWGWVWGPLGMFLSVPLTVMARIVLESSERWWWVAALLAARPRIRGPVGPGPGVATASAAPAALGGKRPGELEKGLGARG